MIMGELKLKFPPRKWQILALHEWLLNNLTGVIQVVTGGGKTYFALMCILEFLKRFKNGQVFIIVPTLTLLDQWVLNLQENLSIDANQISEYSGEHKAKSTNLINIFVINTARNEITNRINPNRPTFLIVDECHRAGSKENSKALHGHFQATLGLSATPQREYDNNLSIILEPALGKLIYEYDYRKALEDGIISNFEIKNVEIMFNYDEKKKYDAISKRIAIEITKLKKVQVSDETKLKNLLQQRASIINTASMRLPMAIMLAELHTNEQIIIFHERVNSANIILDNLISRGHKATIYHSQIPPAIRRDNLTLFKKGVFNILVTCRALDEGFNVPEARVAIISSSTASSRQRIQRLGRVLRTIPGKTISTIYTIYVSEQEQKRLLQEMLNYNDIASFSWLRGKII